eukprot:scaffold71849_cov75-Phaeocystis_antarctica.AAC.3
MSPLSRWQSGSANRQPSPRDAPAHFLHPPPCRASARARSLPSALHLSICSKVGGTPGSQSSSSSSAKSLTASRRPVAPQRSLGSLSPYSSRPGSPHSSRRAGRATGTPGRQRPHDSIRLVPRAVRSPSLSTPAGRARPRLGRAKACRRACLPTSAVDASPTCQKIICSSSSELITAATGLSSCADWAGLGVAGGVDKPPPKVKHAGVGNAPKTGTAASVGSAAPAPKANAVEAWVLPKANAASGAAGVAANANAVVEL